MEAMSRLPAGTRKGVLVNTAELTGLPTGGASAGSGKTPIQLLLDGVNTQPHDVDSASEAAGRMIGNMIKNGRVFGRSIADPSFHGQAG